MAAEIVTAVVMVGLFALGFLLGKHAGWTHCWRELTKDDAWRKGPDE